MTSLEDVLETEAVSVQLRELRQLQDAPARQRERAVLEVVFLDVHLELEHKELVTIVAINDLVADSETREKNIRDYLKAGDVRPEGEV